MLRIAPQLTGPAALAWFSGTLGVSFAKGILNEEFCGCFGAAQVSPWAAAALSAGALCGMLWTWPQHPDTANGNPDPANRNPDPTNRIERKTSPVAQWTALAVLPLALGAVALFQIVLSGRAEITLDGEIVGSSRAVHLHPEKWVGRPLPLLPHIKIDVPLAEGDWLIGFIRTGCTTCEGFVKRYERLAAHWPSGHGFPRLALIDVAPISSTDNDGNDSRWGIAHGHLAPERHWDVAVPLELRLREGSVSSLTAGTDLGY